MSRLDLVRRLALAVVLLSLVAGCSRERQAVPAADVTPTRPATALVVVTPGAAPTGPSGMPNLGVPAQSTALPQVYTVQSGDTLGAIASRFGVDLAALVAANGIADPDSLQVGQQLKIPAVQLAAGPADRLLPDSEFVNGPAYVGFDTSAFCTTRGGYLASYQENVEGVILSGPEIVSLVVRDYSVGPRLLLAVLESISGWVTSPAPSEVEYAMGDRRSGRESLYVQLQWAANQLNQGYYDWRGRGIEPINWGDGTGTSFSPTLNAATAGLQYFYSLVLRKEEWVAAVSDKGLFLSTYRRLFGDPDALAFEPLIPVGTQQPTLSLPWSRDEMWYLTSGPHGGWGEGSAWASVDFVPDEGYLGCQVAASWALAAAAGLVIQSEEGQVKIDLDGDGHEETGWVLLYLHVAADGRVPISTPVKRGDRIGHPSCEGGYGDATHLHFARKFGGEWIAAGGPLPMVLDGWQMHSAGTSYDGTATRGDQVREACVCQTADVNGLSAGQ